jgi:predicted nucleic-acid-binding Zn-ribbon protein
MPLSDDQMDKFEAHIYKKTTQKCPMCGGRKFEYRMDPLLMFRVDATAPIKIPDIERGRVFVFVNFLECGYYVFLSLIHF